MSTVAKHEEMEIVTAVNWKPLLKLAISARISFKFFISVTYVEPMKVIRVSRIRCTFILIQSIYLLLYATYQKVHSELTLKSSYKRATRNFLNPKAQQASAMKSHVPQDVQEQRAWAHFLQINRGKGCSRIFTVLIRPGAPESNSFGLENTPRNKA